MPDYENTSSLQLDQDEDSNRREWRFERAGWLLLATLVVAGLAGAFGDGPLTQREARADDGRTVVRYDRVVRVGAESMLSVIVTPGGPGDTVVTLSLDRAFVERAGVERVSPEPVEVRGTTTRLEYDFRLAADRSPLRADFVFSPTGPGRQRATVGTASGSLVIPQIVLP